MPYSVSKTGSGCYKVRDRNTGKTYSHHCQSKAMAQRQMRAMYANSNEKGVGNKK